MTDGGQDSKLAALENVLLDETADPVDLPFSLLSSITGNFSEAQEIGRGGFGAVYKGVLPSGRTIAVKKLFERFEILDKNFESEIACLVGVKHKNTVRFLGYCSETQHVMRLYEGRLVWADVRQRLLCFEYLPKGCLADYLSDASCRLQWTTRYQIIKGICEGIHYLHQQRIIHMDLKPQNVLLDDNMVPRIADFGLSRRLSGSQSRAITDHKLGTMGYMAPEFINEGEITFKTDIYSLGVIIMEILVGHKESSSVKEVVESWTDMFGTSNSHTSLEHVKACAEIGIECTNYYPGNRPATWFIIRGILGDAEISNWPVTSDVGTSTEGQISIASKLVDELKLTDDSAVAPSKLSPSTLEVGQDDGKLSQERKRKASNISFSKLADELKLMGNYVACGKLMDNSITPSQLQPSALEVENEDGKISFSKLADELKLMDDFVAPFQLQPSSLGVEQEDGIVSQQKKRRASTVSVVTGVMSTLVRIPSGSSAAAPMPENGVELAAVPPSADTSTGLTDANGGNNLNIDGRIHELSEIIIHEMCASQETRPRKPEIFRVPETFLAADEGAYQPRFLSLGPYHRGDSTTEEMRRTDERKLENLRYALRDGGPSVEEYMEAIASMAVDARSSYDGDVAMEWGAFCRMLLLDGFQLITVLEFLGYEPPPLPAPAPGCSSNSNGQGNCRPKTGVVISIGHDLMMLENQIPFFVAQRIHRMRYGIGGNGMQMAEELAWRTIKSIMNDVPAESSHPPAECHHLVHLCHEYLKPSNLDKSLGACGDYRRFRRATEYYEAGVKFRRLNSEADGSSRRPLLDVTFSDGVVRMAHQRVDEKTNYILRNVLVYEQRYHDTATGGAASYVTAYVVFMSQLLGGPEDVALLSRRGVMEHHLGDDAEVCALYRGLAQGLVFDPSGGHYLSTVGVRLQSHHRSRLNRWRAWVMRHRFGNPWLAVAWVFGSMPVLGTIVQTVIALLPCVTHQGPTRNVGS